MDNNNELLHQLGDYLGLPLKFNDDDQCVLVFDETLMVSIKNKKDSWGFQCILSDIPLDAPVEYYQYYLMLNLALAERMLGSIFYEPESRELIYIVSLSMPASYARLLIFLEEVVDQYEQLHQQISSQSFHCNVKQNDLQFNFA